MSISHDILVYHYEADAKFFLGTEVMSISV